MKVFPTRLFYFQGIDPEIDRRVVSGGVAVSGDEDTIGTDGGGRVTVELSSADLDSPKVAAAWSAIDALSDGGPVPFIVPLTDARRQMMGTVTTPIGGLPWWSEADFADTAPHAFLTASAALRATTIAVDVTNLPAAIHAGIWLSIDHPVMRHRAYKIAEVKSDNGSVAVLSIRPPLRRAAMGGAAVEFLDPKCVMRIDGGLKSASMFGYVEPGSVRFVEDFSGAYA
jgi:hypothetical protein